MATTKNKLAEQITRIVSGGSANRASDLDSREVILFIEQERDRIIFTDYLQNRNLGDYDIHADWITTLRNQTIKKAKYTATDLQPEGIITIGSHSIAVNDYVRVSGTTNFNGYFKVTAVTSTTITIDISGSPDGETSATVSLPHEDFVDLPYMPMSLPNDRGVFGVFANEYEDYKFINIGAGGSSLFKRMIGMLANSTSHNTGMYYQNGNRIYIKDYGVRDYNPSTLTIQLVASAKDLGNDEVLPIPAQYESEIIKSAIQVFGAMQAVQDDEVNDSIN